MASSLRLNMHSTSTLFTTIFGCMPLPIEPPRNSEVVLPPVLARVLCVLGLTSQISKASPVDSKRQWTSPPHSLPPLLHIVVSVKRCYCIYIGPLSWRILCTANQGSCANLANFTGWGPTSMVASLMRVTILIIWSGTSEAKYLLIRIITIFIFDFQR